MANAHIPLQPGHTYHVWTHANGSENLFIEKDNYHYFLDRYHHHVHPIVETFAYCLMPNHLHLMVRIKKEDELIQILDVASSNPTGFENLSGLISKQFGNLFNAYTKAFNKKYGRKGSLFIRPFKRRLIDSDEYFVKLIAYIHNNPVHHGFVNNPNNWPFSSWHTYLMNEETNISKQKAMAWFGTEDNFRVIHQQLNQDKMKDLFEE